MILRSWAIDNRTSLYNLKICIINDDQMDLRICIINDDQMDLRILRSWDDDKRNEMYNLIVCMCAGVWYIGPV